jgi:hypothetical protein
LAEQSRSVSATSLTSVSTVAEVSSWWLQNIAAVRVRPSSLGKYVDRVERITAHLGDVRTGNLGVEQIARWQATLLESLSPKSPIPGRRCAPWWPRRSISTSSGSIRSSGFDRRTPERRASGR